MGKHWFNGGMTLPLTPSICEAAYSFLMVTPPFNRWKMPPADEVTFHVVGSFTDRGWHKFEDGKHHVAIAIRSVAHTSTLFPIMAHEMLHVHQEVRRTRTLGVQHNAEFCRLADRVCKYHGFDPKAFL